MGYVDRAKSMYARGDSVRAANILAQGLKRDPSDVEAVEWLLHLYVEEVPNPGMEAEVLQVLAGQRNGGELLEIVEAELAELGAADKLKAIDKVRQLQGIRFPSTAPVAAPGPEPARPAPSPEAPRPTDSRRAVDPPRSELGSSGSQRVPVPTGENWEAFDNPYEGEQVSGGFPAARSEPSGDPDDWRTQPLGTLDTLPDDLRAEYLNDDPLPSERPLRDPRRNIALVAVVAAIVVAAIALYSSSRERVEPTPDNTWAEEGSGT